MSKRRLEAPKKRAFTVPYATLVSRETFLAKLRETEAYLLEHRYADIQQMKTQGAEGAGDLLFMLAVHLSTNVRCGSIQKWKESGLEFHVPLVHLAEVASWILMHPAFEFDPAWPYTKQEMIDICKNMFERKE